MPNAYIPRPSVHAWSDDIGENTPDHQSALTRLLKQQRRLTRFIEQNQEDLAPGTAQVGVYLFGVIARIFDLAGGRLRGATWAQINAASAKVRAAAAEVLPADDGFAERLRKLEGRAQPHILDEAILALFERPPADEEAQVDKNEALKLFLMMWVATEVLDENWQPAKGFEGESEYAFTPVEVD